MTHLGDNHPICNTFAPALSHFIPPFSLNFSLPLAYSPQQLYWSPDIPYAHSDCTLLSSPWPHIPFGPWMLPLSLSLCIVNEYNKQAGTRFPSGFVVV